MRIAYTSDIHIDTSERNREAVDVVADVVGALHPDVIVIAGDAGNTIGALEETLRPFTRFDTPKFFVPGNHDVWVETRDETFLDSRVKFDSLIPEACRLMGFHDLGHSPVVLDNIGFVGSLGWYDYTFADPRLGLEHDDYWKGRYGDEVWWDREMTYWIPIGDAYMDTPKERMRDAEVCMEMVERLEDHLSAIETRASRIVAVIHTLPFLAGLSRSNPPYYLDAYTGSERLGETLTRHPGVEHCIGAHKHLSGDWQVGRIKIHRRILGRIDKMDDIHERAKEAVGLIEL